MNFYKRFVGDFQRKTSHLSCMEIGVYDRLLDHYYAVETPLPPDVDSCCRIARAMTKDERKAVQTVLSGFFTLTERGYIQARVEEEIAEAQPKIAAARANGSKGGRPKRSIQEPNEKPTGLFLGNPPDNPNETQHESDTEPIGQASQSQSIDIGIQSTLAKEKRSVCVEQHTQNFEKFRTAMREIRQDLDFETVFENFRGHYAGQPAKLTLAKWRQWVQNERVGGGAGEVPDDGSEAARAAHEATLSRIEAENSRKTVGPTEEQREKFARWRREMSEKSGLKAGKSVGLGVAA